MTDPRLFMLHDLQEPLAAAGREIAHLEQEASRASDALIEAQRRQIEAHGELLRTQHELSMKMIELSRLIERVTLLSQAMTDEQTVVRLQA